MKEKGQMMRKASSCSSQCNSSDELMESEQTDRELYLFIRGGFGAK